MAKKRECKQQEFCPKWDTCPFKHDLNACRVALSAECSEDEIEEID